MKSLISFKDETCKHCLKCVRHCPTKSICFENDTPYIIEHECIHCGMCYLCCPQSAIVVEDDLKKVQNWLNEKCQVVLSVPSVTQMIWENFSSLKKDLLDLGFYAVEECVDGASVVSGEIGQLMKEHQMENMIDSSCPVVVELIEKEYPELLHCLLPIASPMGVHARMLKKKYPKAHIVHMTPCVARQFERERFCDVLDAVISIPQVDEWIMTRHHEKEEKQDQIAHLYAMTGGITQTIEDLNGYKSLAVEGIERCRAVLDSIQKGHLKGYFFEMNACLGGCLGGPYMLAYKDDEWLTQSKLRVHEKDQKIRACHHLDTEVTFMDRSTKMQQFSEKEIEEALSMMGKSSHTRGLDCGACGYDSCREKAIAVLSGKSDPKHCLPYALESAQSEANLIMKYSPNGIIVVDSDRKIKEINASALRLLGQEGNVKGTYIENVLSNEQLMRYMNEKILDVQYIGEVVCGSKVCDIAILPIVEEEAFVLIMMDLTNRREQEQKMRKIRRDTIESTQRVIDKQMRVVQEIASLLGETTAETKVVLTKLNKAIDGEEL